MENSFSNVSSLIKFCVSKKKSVDLYIINLYTAISLIFNNQTTRQRFSLIFKPYSDTDIVYFINVTLNFTVSNKILFNACY